MRSSDLSPELLQAIAGTQSQPTGRWGGGFMQGFIVGQLSVIVVVIVFIRFFIFAEAASPNSTKKHVPPKITSLGSKTSQAVVENKPNGDGTESEVYGILEKTYYNVDNHAPESMDWFNVLAAQLVMEVRREALFNQNVYHTLDNLLNSSSLSKYTDKISITEVNVGDDFPIFSNCRISNTDGRLEAKMDVDVSDTITIAVETSFLLNQPKPMTASLPVKISVSVVRFSGRLTTSLVCLSQAEEGSLGSIQLRAEPDDEEKQTFYVHDINMHDITADTRTALMVAVAPDFRLEFDIKSLIGSKAKLENMPRLASILENVLRKWFIDHYVEPKFYTVRIPNFWKSKKDPAPVES